MTEDDTFRVLQRTTSFYEMMKIYRSGVGPKYPNNRKDEWTKFFAQYDWTWQEFCKEWKEWNGGTDTYSAFERSKK